MNGPKRKALKTAGARPGPKPRRKGAAIANDSDRYRSLVDIGLALSSEKELPRILDLVLEKALETTGADGATIYLIEQIRIDTIGNAQKKFFPVLRVHRAISRLEGSRSINLMVAMDHSSIAGYVALTGDSVSIADCYDLPAGSQFQFNPETDRTLGYRTTSMLAVPLLNADGKVRGVLQMINKLGEAPPSAEQIPFTGEDAELMRAFASQACVALEHAKLREDIENLFESFIRASVTAIEARDPTTSGHSDRVAVLTVEFARAAHFCQVGPYQGLTFSEQQIRELRYASLLHDFGKIGVRESILAKEKKLYPHELETILLRLDSARARHEMMAWKETAEELASLLADGRIEDPAFRLSRVNKKIEVFTQQLHQVRVGIVGANQPQIREEDFDIGNLMSWIHKTSREIGQVLLTPEEMVKLSLPRGTLGEDERREIESHVSHTYRFLRQIAWTEDLANVADIAHAHHEKCDGSGYPRALTSAHIPVQSKMMAIADIYDALTSMDRPYKPATSPERAIEILHMEAKEGKLDLDLIKIFVEAGVFRMAQGMGNRRAA